MQRHKVNAVLLRDLRAPLHSHFTESRKACEVDEARAGEAHAAGQTKAGQGLRCSRLRQQADAVVVDADAVAEIQTLEGQQVLRDRLQSVVGDVAAAENEFGAATEPTAERVEPGAVIARRRDQIPHAAVVDDRDPRDVQH